MPGWNYMVRLYRPRKEILDGTWKFRRRSRYVDPTMLHNSERHEQFTFVGPFIIAHAQDRRYS